jgi:high affinity Mn2+ porin
MFLGARLWPGAAAYFVPEIISERPLSDLKGLGGAIQNAELQKGGGAAPTLYMSRVYLRQTIGLGGERVEKKSDAMQLGGVVDSRRLSLTVGKLSVLDFLDKNSLAGDLRRQFMNMAFLTHASYDFAADARGYAWGATAELYYDDWALRVARLTPPRDPNQLSIDFKLDEHYGDQVEVEHVHEIAGLAGAVRVLGYRNREQMGRFDDAVAAFRADPGKNATNPCPGFSYGPGNAGAPDLCWVRRANIKAGVGVNVEQHVASDVGVFFRGMVSDGQTEVYSFTSTDRSLSFGALAMGSIWHRPADVTGVGLGLGWISEAHGEYLRLGGVDGFIGDGGLRRATESVLEVFYSANLIGGTWLSLDYQRITNPGFNADRGPVDVLGARFHAEI